MTWWIWALIGIYLLGIIVVLAVHLTFLQMVTPELAFMRAVVWPIFWLTGWPHSSLIPMD